ncbi:hypothetical protein PAPYR_6485 [Paratrimastix pyriformis]|uniref:Uncharacterized protein n=1 Tax=Paratrimastix pyriformis TaxID=342808 RepID=A0ABQ8UID3_9EUKA|nr:hypothetical protein PAPYR_6485 [Paratrimastix pyriformis]
MSDLEPVLNILVGAKADLRSQLPQDVGGTLFSTTELISPVDAERVARSLGSASYVECSAKDNVGVDQLFHMIAENAVKMAREPLFSPQQYVLLQHPGATPPAVSSQLPVSLAPTPFATGVLQTTPLNGAAPGPGITLQPPPLPFGQLTIQTPPQPPPALGDESPMMLEHPPPPPLMDGFEQQRTTPPESTPSMMTALNVPPSVPKRKERCRIM